MTSPAKNADPSAKKKTTRSILISSNLGMSCGASDSRKSCPQPATRNPSKPPIRVSTTLSETNCRMRCRRFAPSAVRTATSPSRCTIWAKRRWITFAHAISKTNATAPNRMNSAVRTFFTMSSRKGTTVALKFLSVRG